jgi:hypothetical protein
VFFGVPGIAAVILGAISLAPITSGKRRGAWITAIAIMLGVVDVVGWVVVVGKVFKNHPAAGLNIADFRVSEADLKGAPPIVASALRANVLITRGGPLSLTLGSGVILSIADGSALILTNNHVASPDTRDEGGEVTVQYVDGRTATGKVVWNAPQGVDASLVRVPIPSGCAAGVATIDLSIAPHIGDDVFAVGNPQGLGWTHTKGAISQFRERSAGSASPVSLRIIQTSAPINHGNSGGGLYAAAGQLVGINTYAADKREAEGLGFAISLDSLKVVMPQWAIDAIKAARKPAPKAEGAEEGTP